MNIANSEPKENKMQFEIKSRWDETKVLFTAELGAEFEIASYGVKL